MLQSVKNHQNRIFAVLAAALMAVVLFGGQFAQNPSESFAPGAVYASGVNDLWDQAGVGEVGKDLQNNGTDMGIVVTKGQEIAQTVTSLLTIVSFVSLLFWIARLALSAGNPQTRRVAVTGIWVSGVALALFGGAWVVVGFFWNILSGVSTTNPA